MLRRQLFPLAQIGAAGLAFLLWGLMSVRLSAGSQLIPVRSFTAAVPLSLTLSLGVSYLLPNLYRGTDPSLRRVRGPWSGALSISMVLPAALAMGGLGAALIPSTSPRLDLIVAVISSSASLAFGVLTAQIGRIVERLRLVLLGVSAPVILPALWLAVRELDLGTGATVVFASAQALYCLACFCVLRSGAEFRRLPWKQLRTLGSVSLVPHLVLFGVIIQGMRVPASFGGAGQLVVAHQLMLCASVGYTLLASGNAQLSVALQVADPSDLDRVLRTSARRYSVLSVTSAIAALIAVLAAQTYASTSHSSLVGALAVTMIPLCVLNVGFYYSLSTQFMRASKTSPVLLSSSSSVAILAASSLLPQVRDSTSLTLVAYAFVTAILPAPLLFRRGQLSTLSTRSASCYWIIPPLAAASAVLWAVGP